MAWIETHQELPEHPKTYEVAAALGLTQLAAVGLLICTWLWALQFAKDGFISERRLVAAAGGAKWTGDPTAYAEAMVSAGLWDVTEGGWQIHDWEIYTGKLIERRRVDAERKKNPESKSSPAPRAIRGTSDGVSNGLPQDGGRTKPNQTVPNHTTPTPREDEQGVVSPRSHQVTAVPAQPLKPVEASPALTISDLLMPENLTAGERELIEAEFLEGGRGVHQLNNVKQRKLLAWLQQPKGERSRAIAWAHGEEWSDFPLKTAMDAVANPSKYKTFKALVEANVVGMRSSLAPKDLDPGLSSKPWAESFTETNFPQSLGGVMSFASKHGTEAMATEAGRIFRSEGFEAACDWVWERCQRKAS